MTEPVPRTHSIRADSVATFAASSETYSVFFRLRATEKMERI